MTYRIKNKNKVDKVQVITYLTEREKSLFKTKCRAQGNTCSSVLRDFVLQYIK